MIIAGWIFLWLLFVFCTALAWAFRVGAMWVYEEWIALFFQMIFATLAVFCAFQAGNAIR